MRVRCCARRRRRIVERRNIKIAPCTTDTADAQDSEGREIDSDSLPPKCAEPRAEPSISDADAWALSATYRPALARVAAFRQMSAEVDVTFVEPGPLGLSFGSEGQVR